MDLGLTKLIDILQAYNYVQNPPQNSPINQLPIIINGDLLSYKLPSETQCLSQSLVKCPYYSVYDSNHPSKSISGLLNKAIKLFTTYKVDTTPFVNQAASAYTEVCWMTLHCIGGF